MANVEPPISSRVSRKVYLRPTMSPMRPNTTAPNGRTTKPTAKAASVLSKAASGLVLREKLCGNNGRQRAEDVEVVPLNDGTHRRGRDHLPDFADRRVVVVVLHRDRRGAAKRARN